MRDVGVGEIANVDNVANVARDARLGESESI